MKHTHKHFFAACAAAVSMAFAAMPVYAEETAPQGYVTIAVEKLTTGEGYILEPVAVPFFAGDTGAELTERALGAEQINEGAGMGTYIASIADPEGGTGTVPEVIRNAVTKNPLASPYYRSRLVWFVRRLIMRKYDCFIASEKYLRQYANSLVGIYGVWYAKTNLAERS